MAKITKKTKKKKVKKQVTKGRVYISASFNNTKITFTNPNGDVLCWTTAGSAGFKGSKKGTPYAAGEATKAACEKAKSFGMEEVDVFVKGVGAGRELAIRTLASSGLKINSIRDITPIPHNGCRPKKVRRV